MRVGITGATGYIGGHLARACHQRGDEVIGFTRSAERDTPDYIDQFRQIASLKDVSQSVEASRTDVSGLDALVHLAAEPIFGIWTPEKRDRVWNSRILITRHLVEEVRALPADARPKVFLSASGIAWYGDTGEEWVDESDPRGKGWFPELTEAWEKEAMAMEELGVRVVCARTGVVLGRKSPACGLFSSIFGIGAGGRLGDGEQWFSWVDIQDHVQMSLQALDDESLKGPVNFVAPEPVKNRELTEALGSVMERPTLMPVPGFGVKLVFRELAAELLDSHRVKPAIFQSRGFEFHQVSVRDALEDALRQSSESGD